MDNKMCAIELIALAIAKQDEKKAREQAELEKLNRQTEFVFDGLYRNLVEKAERGEIPEMTFLLNQTKKGDYRAVKQVPWRYSGTQYSYENDYDLLDYVNPAHLIKLFNDLCFECEMNTEYEKKGYTHYSYGSGTVTMVQFIVKPQPECFSLLGEQAFGPGHKFFIKTP